MMNLNSRIAQLLEILVNRWSFWDEHEDIYLELALTLVADPAASPERWERELFHEIRAELNPEDWQNLPELIRAYQVAVRRQRQEERRRRNEERRQRQEERRQNEERRQRQEEQQSRDEERERREEEQREEERQTLLGKLRELFEQNFLAAHSFYHDRCTEHISADEYETEKINYVQSWAEGLGLEYPPDPEQAAAIGAVEGNVQVVARAGSGKTATLVNRALFLQEHCDVKSDEMLLLAFNRKAAEQMRERLASYLQDSIPHVRTFHALAHNLVHPEKILFDEPDGEQSQSRALQDIIDHYLGDPNYYNKIRALMMEHFRADWERIISGGRDKTPDALLRYRRSLTWESLDGKYVKSFGEKAIANFLFEHNIEYKYEQRFPWDGVNYCPDFTIENNHRVIIEYFGLKGDPDYDEMSEEKRSYWRKKPNWRLLEFSPNDLTSNEVEDFYALLKRRLEVCEIPCNRLSEQEIWERIKHLRPIDRFTRVIVQFIKRCRKLSLTSEQLPKKISNYNCSSDIEQRFLDLAQVFYESYLERFETTGLQATGEEDFDGLIQKAAEHIATGKTVFGRKSGSGDLKRIRYVLVDEYQDFSELFYRLMDAVREQNPRVRFFCVGDDWQAINGFAGSDLHFFQNFEQFFEDSCELHVATNYRSARTIVEVGNTLMRGLGTPARAHKTMVGKVAIADLGTFEPTSQEKKENPGDNFTPAVLRLVHKVVNDGKNVVLLSRKNSLPLITGGHNRLLNFLHSGLPSKLAKKVTISTVHKYKGLEKTVVIVLDAVPQCYPLLHPNLVFTRIFGDSIERIIAEERRLFYVALTRAVEELFILTEADNFSPFLEDLESNIKLSRLEWSDYPLTEHITIRVSNQDGRGTEPTKAIKRLLRSDNYRWYSKSKFWYSIRPIEGFSVKDFINRAMWSKSADGIAVRFYDLENKVALYHVDRGQWSFIYDNIRE